MRRIVIMLGVLASTAMASEKHDDFKAILKRVEQHYGKQHLHLPFVGLLSFASHFTRPLGASDFKLAVIEGVGSPSIPPFVPGPEWRPVIRSTSREGDSMVMWGRDEGRTAIRTLMVIESKEDTVVMQMRLGPTHFLKMLADKSKHE